MAEPKTRASTAHALTLVDAALKSAPQPVSRATVAVDARVDPKTTRMNEFHRRMDSTMEGDAIKGLISSFRATGQKAPVKGYRLPHPDADGTQLVLIYGARRRAAAIAAGMDLWVQIVPKPSDADIVVEMLMENSHRVNYQPLEDGREWKASLDRGAFSSAKALADATGLDDTKVQRCVAIASLPDTILSLYSDPSWMPLVKGTELVTAYQQGGEVRARLMEKAEELAKGPTGKDPTGALLAAIAKPAAPPVATRYVFNKKEVARAVAGKRGTGEVRITVTSGAPEKLRNDLLAVLERHLQKARR